MTFSKLSISIFVVLSALSLLTSFVPYKICFLLSRGIYTERYDEHFNDLKLDMLTKSAICLFVTPITFGETHSHVPNPLAGLLIIVLWSIFFVLSWLLPRCGLQDKGFNAISIQVLAFVIQAITCLVVQLILIWILTLPTISVP